ncbi:MAG: adenylosuccinate synthase [Aquificaceae bacterium]|nr:adenylosuccinate synthase [Aquificaceae bacterium]MCX8059992.1 adenylosuccinate synthase [Aquificaceae bacterium]MDW8096847.1 adenylosuccinate synthase [Aquificaceae bacterium]
MKRGLVILGAQWGDEGKGKVVDLLSADFSATVRYQGGSNAGHTVLIKGEKFVLHLLPTGMLHEHTLGVVAQGMVVDLELLVKEIEELESRGLSVRDRLFISDRVHLVMPYHKVLDSLFESKGKIGTTLRGIGPSYMLKYGRRGIRVCDLENPDRAYRLMKENMEFVHDLCEKVYCENHTLSLEEIFEKTLEHYRRIRDRVTDTTRWLLQYEGEVLFEGAQGTMLDVDMGTYPYVTSSNSSALGLSNGTGLPPRYFSNASFWGVSKAYATRVGEGPFPTELTGEEGQELRERGKEYGATTGRPRRCGWLDLVALKHAVEVNGLDGLVLTKLDVLDHFEEIKVCVAYQRGQDLIYHFPASLDTLLEVKPVYKTFKGWRKDTRGARSLSELPQGALDYLEFIQEYLGVPIVMLSTGPEREEYLWLRPYDLASLKTNTPSPAKDWKKTMA